MTNVTPTILSTVSSQFVDDWLAALRALCPEAQMAALLSRSGLNADTRSPNGRVTLDQIVCLYQLAAVETGDEMMGLWSRPVRPRALQHLLTTVREATSLSSALYRFSTFWNLLLDDYQFVLDDAEGALVLTLKPQGEVPLQRFGHMLILKLAHGLMSWLAGHEVPVKAVDFAFDRPDFDQDYAIIFPAPLRFGQPATAIAFDPNVMGPVQTRSTADLDRFLQNAPRDWIFTSSREHTQSLRVRTYLGQTGWDSATLTQTASAMHMTPRTLIRRLHSDGTSFQAIKDALRRDIAIRDLQAGRKSVEAIALDVGFSSAANFHRAFQRWTGSTPSSYRRTNI
ncbi:transcriptional regulator, AraC family [Ruegeria halocynthiae]|uniref:Transcriptional regulator, AraC family n=1 Tax=Ruegeria halocynthiae TaxID=985054 RepID=A0A1H3DEG2_9RHOB|nr:AraC family transcriptional regulator [Ruegeria halocynthiae]SDX64710.1 transcriptional regulator, AraC family [Ruegeria halocynthiae]